MAFAKLGQCSLASQIFGIHSDRGRYVLSWVTDTLHPQTVEQKETVYLQSQRLHIMVKNAAQASKAGPGLYSWSFTFQLDPNMPETVPRLLEDVSICYCLTAEVSTGLLTKSLSTCERIRIIKSPSFWADQLFIAPEVSVNPRLSHSLVEIERANASRLTDASHNDTFDSELSDISSTTLPTRRWGT